MGDLEPFALVVGQLRAGRDSRRTGLHDAAEVEGVDPLVTP
jgi:hypothetical protein